MNQSRKRFSYVKYDQEQAAKSEAFKKSFEALEDQVESVLKPGREKSLVITKLEEAFMWCGKALRDEMLSKSESVPHEPARTNA